MNRNRKSRSNLRMKDMSEVKNEVSKTPKFTPKVVRRPKNEQR